MAESAMEMIVEDETVGVQKEIEKKIWCWENVEKKIGVEKKIENVEKKIGVEAQLTDAKNAGKECLQGEKKYKILRLQDKEKQLRMVHSLTPSLPYWTIPYHTVP